MRSLAEWLRLQESVHPRAIDMDLARVTRVAQALGVQRPTYPVITVAGTNGKGSTVAHIEAVLRASGLHTGMFTSPHLVRYNERIRIGGEEAADEELIAAFERIERARGTTTLTFFEYNTLAALLIFRDRAIDVGVLEVGLGGRLDATNLVDATVAVICSIGFDHRDWLGDSLELIGAEKAGIVRAGRPVVLSTAVMPASVFATIEKAGARASVAGRDFRWRLDPPALDSQGPCWSYFSDRAQLAHLPPSALAGSIQYGNAAAALAAVEALGLTDQPSRDAVVRALSTVKLPGRYQIVAGHPEWILDIAHNEPAARVLAAHLRERPHGGRTWAVVAILEDKDARAIVEAVRPLIDNWVLCSLPGPRGISATELAARVAVPADGVTLASSVEAGCEAAQSVANPGDRILVFGSVRTVGTALQWLRL